ncbi:hypothetical protein D9758_015391 [Tetrapyrgos nigripes]|uniref:Carboxylic ester hydrolase n=1 Tax=Tetrapyrgos nigripes TaxID=182062 RepID=A0A8H5FIK3_9AGAR|nr:hypothetical protein D9758_015391 [Tetrapyrgos nigripes]
MGVELEELKAWILLMRPNGLAVVGREDQVNGILKTSIRNCQQIQNGTENGNPSDFPQSVLDLINTAAVQQCNSLDGLSDGLIATPLNCSFNPRALACSSNADTMTECLTPFQLSTALGFYNGAIDPITNNQLYPGFVPGSELTWTGISSIYEIYTTTLFQNTWANNLSYDPLADFSFFGSDLAKVHDGLGVFINANNPDLSKFHARGGKLILSQSMADNINPQKFPLDYYTRIKEALHMSNDEIDSWFRLFHVPGASHCGGGPGPNFFDPIPQLVQWVEDPSNQPSAPDRIIATKFNNDTFSGGLNRTMPLCPWPKAAIYVGGNVDVASSSECR